MSQLLRITTAIKAFEVGDTGLITPDGHQWSPADLQNFVTLETGLTLSDAEINKLRMDDEVLISYSAISQLPTFRSLATGRKNTTFLHRRKYQYINGEVILKANAQEHN